MSVDERKIIIVEGKTDKEKLERIVNESMDIVCTHGTLDIERLDYLIEEYQLDNRETFIFVDEDPSGKRLRKQLAKELPHATHIYIDKNYREVAATPDSELAVALVSARISIDPFYLL